MTLTAEQLANLDAFVTYAVSYVDAAVAKYKKGLAATAPQTAEEKRQLAISVARELAPDDLRRFPDAALEKVIDAKVQDRRASMPTAAVASVPPLPPASRVPSDLTGLIKKP